MAELRLDNLTKVFPGKNPGRALDGLSLTIGSGECVALLGPSGAGKSTVLRLVAGLETPTTGTIQIDGDVVSGTSAAARQVAMAFQFPALLPQLSVEQNLRLGLDLRGCPNARARVESIAERLGITPLLSRKPDTLSGGEQQRISLGRALVTQPRILLLDEPLASLDPVARTALREMIRGVQREFRVTTLYVTHDQTEAAEVADRIALLRGGKLEQFGTAQEIYANPFNLFVAKFFGVDGLNAWTVPLSIDGGRVCAMLGCIRIPIGPGSAAGNRREVVLACRPSAVQISSAPDGRCVVEERRDLGWINIVRVNVGKQVISGHEGRAGSLRAGDLVSVAIDSARIHLFDVVSGERLK